MGALAVGRVEDYAADEPARARLNGRLIAWLSFVIAFATLNYAARFFVTSNDNSQPAYQYGAAVAGLIQYAIVFGIVLWISRGMSLRRIFALRSPRSWRP